MTWKTFRYYVYGSVLTTAVFFGTIELVTRMVSWFGDKGFTLAVHELEPYDQKVTDIYQWHPFTGIIFRPNIHFQAGHPFQEEMAWIDVDKYGFLANDQALSFKKGSDEIRIATIGGSTTANINLAFDENWPGRLAFLVQEALPDKTVTIINGGVPGFDTAQSIVNLALRIMPFNPDIVIIYHAYNDLKAIRGDVAFKPDYSHIHDMPYGYHEKPFFLIRWLNHSMFYVRARNKYRVLIKVKGIATKENDNTRLSSVPMVAERTFEQHMSALIAIARSGGAKVVLSSFSTLHDPSRDYSRRDVVVELSDLQKNELYSLLHFIPGLTVNGIFEGIKRYNAALKNVAEEKKTGWVDNANRIPHRDEYFVDRVHLSRKGTALMAENLLPVVVEKLGR